MSSAPSKMVLDVPEQSSDSEDLPDTQPMDSQDPEFEISKEAEKEEEAIWGQLYPHCGTFPRIPLKTDSFKLGRAFGDYLIKESDIGRDMIITISSTQCEIIRNKDGVFLKDYSTNGTFVNGHKVRKGNTYPMSSDADISFTFPHKKAFKFVSNLEVPETFPPEFTSKFTMGRVLGTGASGEVRLAYRVQDMFRVAVKIIKKPTGNPFVGFRGSSEDQILREVEILQSVNHSHIISLVDIINTPEQIYIVLELAEGGELKKMIGKEELNESLAKAYFQQIANAIDYLHSRQICHRDLKLENILICSEDQNNPIIKISDMGLSKFVDQTMLKTICGTRAYLAPEILEAAGSLGTQKYTVKVDCWALGVILYELLFGKKPFSPDRNTQLSLNEQILAADFVFPPKAEEISREALDLIQKLLVVEPAARLSSRDLLSHAWLKKADYLVPNKARKRLAEDVDDSSKLRKVGESTT